MAQVIERDGEVYVVDEWCAQDVTETYPHLTKEQANEVLDLMADKHDCNYGLTWDLMSMCVQELGFQADAEEDSDD